MRFSILCPSRERSHRFAQMVESAMTTKTLANELEILVFVDEDDPQLSEYDRIADTIPCVTLYIGQRAPVGDLCNELARGATGDVLMAGADDVLFRSVGWDARVREVAARFADGLFIASPNNGDGIERVNHWFAGRQWLNLFGWFVVPHFEHFGGDRWVQEVAKPCGRLVYMPDVLIEHMHKKFRNADGTQKAPNDATYRAKREKVPGLCMAERDEALFDALKPELLVDIGKLRAAVNG